ncbi:amidohydrolase [Amycolatopsis anabasis]|uniref:amidohydrolase n=1 Tax=Amycolatopsis anabasis TaxID=1840409 RepID=UPI00131C75F0|nr:amidohydrolase [Amycolatopsis anabasis]
MCEGVTGPGLTRAQFLRLAGSALALTACAPAPDSGGRVLLDNVRGYTFAEGRLREFRSLLVSGDGRVESLDPGNTGGARRIDGRGRVCLPGLHDAHGHIWNFGARATQLDLSGTRSLDEAIAALGRYAGEHRELKWLLGRGWNEVVWGLGRLPSAADLDRVVADRPVWLVRVDGHAAVTNTAGLRAANIGADTVSPPGGEIVRGPDGSPTGVFVDAAKSLVEKVLPPVGPADHEQRLRAAQDRLHRLGLTSVSDAGTAADQLAVLHQQAAAGKLTLRLNVFLSWDAFTAVGDRVRTDSAANDLLRVRTVKLYVDGALGSRGAALLEPYRDAPGSRGLPQLTAQELNARVKRVVDAGYQCAVHAIGDQGNRLVLDAFDQALRGSGGALRHRIEHAQVVSVADIPRFRQLGLIASMQPVHATDDMNMAENRIGHDRMAGAYAWRRMLDQGTVLAAGSDFPVSPESPFEGLHAAVTRTDKEGKPAGGWYPEQAMTAPEALRAFTLDAAYAAHQERVLGSLEPGKWADLVLVDQNPFALEPGRALWQTQVLQTWVAGRPVGEYASL